MLLRWGVQDSPLCFQTNYRGNILVVEWPPPEGPWKFVSKKPTGNVKGLKGGQGQQRTVLMSYADLRG